MSHKILVLGADGYIGYPLCQYLHNAGYDVFALDNGYKRLCWSMERKFPLLQVENVHRRFRYLGIPYYVTSLCISIVTGKHNRLYP